MTTHDPKRHPAEKHLLLVHPACANQAAWYPIITDIILAAGLTLTTVDLRGHGRSDTPDSRCTVPLYAADVAAAATARWICRQLHMGRCSRRQ